MRHAIILAGGKGTRLASRLGDLPKPLVPVAGVPLLERQLCALAECGVSGALVLVNHKAEAIAQFCRARPASGMTVSLVDDGEPRGTAGATLAALDCLPADADDLLIIYGDTLFNIDFARLFHFHESHAGAATLFLHPNDHPHDSDLVELDGNCRVRRIHPYPHPPGAQYQNLVNAALYVVRREALRRFAHYADEPARVIDFARDLFPAMLDAGCTLYGYNSPEYIKDVGTPPRLDKAEEDIASGRFAAGSLRTARAAVFLDRDGVLNPEKGFISRVEDFELLPGTGEALRRLNRSGLLSVVVTNQPVIARGELDEAGLAAIHARMDTLLGLDGAYVDRLYYCPHHPDKGFSGERPELKVRCACRKPGTGMLEQAGRDLHIDFSASWLVGDRTVDMEAARAMGVRSVLVRTGAAGRDGKCLAFPDYVCDDLPAACRFILDAHPAYMQKLAPLAERITPGSLVLVGGLPGAGKSTLASLLKEALRARDITAVRASLDGFCSRDAHRAYDADAIRQAVTTLVRQRTVAWPCRVGDEVCCAAIAAGPDDVIIVEGLPALGDPQLRALADLCLYVECPEAIREARLPRQGANATDLERDARLRAEGSRYAVTVQVESAP